MTKFISLKIDHTTLNVFGDKYLYLPESRSIILSDVHLGKISHFRKNGIQVPIELAQKNLNDLQRIIDLHNPIEMLFLGDLFHSKHNMEWENFKALRFHFSKVRMILLIGNHDIFLLNDYRKANIEVIQKPLKIGNKIFSHEPFHKIKKGQINFHGHVHPAVRLIGKALQSLRLPCFYYSQNTFILPAFGSFTGTCRIKPQKGDRVFVCADGSVYEASKKEKIKESV